VVQIKLKSGSQQTQADSMKDKKFHFAGFIERLLPSSFNHRQVTPGSPETVAAPKGKKVLVVDDDPLFQKIISQKLKASGYLVVLDVNFPPDISNGVSVPWDGFKLMHWIKFVEGRSGVPMFIMTSDDVGQYAAKAKAGGANGIFHKPVDQSRLVSEVDHAFEQKAIAA
jgi:CheY-like chemotaxis protein